MNIQNILNLHAGLGGNRLLWIGRRVTAVEINQQILDLYSAQFKRDIIYCQDAGPFLLNNFDKFDFVWCSPPCPTHSTARVTNRKVQPQFVDLTLWQYIIFLQTYRKLPWVVENVVPYYPPLIRPTVQLGRHYFWSNFPIPRRTFDVPGMQKATLAEMENWLGLKVTGSKIPRKDAVLRNCTPPEIGAYILACAENKIPAAQLDIFADNSIV